MRLIWILIISILMAAGAAQASVVFENATGGNALIPVIGTILFDLDGQSGAGSLVATTNDNDLACSGAGLQTSPPGALIQVDITTGGSLLYYVDGGEFTYDANTGDMRVSAPGLQVACVGSILFFNGFED